MSAWPDASCARLIARGDWGEDEQLQRCQPPIGPRNSASNASYAVSGIAAVLLRPGPEGVLFLLAMLALCYGSWRYHAEKTIRANLLDRVGMFLVLVPLGVLGIWALAGWPPENRPVAMVIAALVCTPVAVYYAPLKAMDLQIGGWLALAALGGFVRGDPWLAGAAMALFFLGYACWQLDKVPRRPLGLWGHAIWHTVTGPAFALMFLAVT